MPRPRKGQVHPGLKAEKKVPMLTVTDFLGLNHGMQALLLTRLRYDTMADTLRALHPGQSELFYKQRYVSYRRQWARNPRLHAALQDRNYDVGEFAQASITVVISEKVRQSIEKLNAAKTTKKVDEALAELKKWEGMKLKMPVLSVAQRTEEAETIKTLNVDDIDLGYNVRKPEFDIRGARTYNPDNGRFTGKADEWHTPDEPAVPVFEDGATDTGDVDATQTQNGQTDQL